MPRTALCAGINGRELSLLGQHGRLQGTEARRKRLPMVYLQLVQTGELLGFET